MATRYSDKGFHTADAKTHCNKIMRVEEVSEQGPKQPLEEKDAEIERLRTALSEIGASAAEAMIRMGIKGFGDGGTLGDSLIYIKDTVDEAFSKA